MLEDVLPTSSVDKPTDKTLEKRSPQWYPPQHRPQVLDIEIQPDRYPGAFGAAFPGGYQHRPEDIDIEILPDHYPGGFGAGFGPDDVEIIIDEGPYALPPYLRPY